MVYSKTSEAKNYIYTNQEIRENRDINQQEIAELLNTTQQQYSKYELGIQLIPIDRLNMLADFYNTSIDYLVGRTDERRPYKKSIMNKTTTK